MLRRNRTALFLFVNKRLAPTETAARSVTSRLELQLAEEIAGGPRLYFFGYRDQWVGKSVRYATHKVV